MKFLLMLQKKKLQKFCVECSRQMDRLQNIDYGYGYSLYVFVCFASISTSIGGHSFRMSPNTVFEIFMP